GTDMRMRQRGDRPGLAIEAGDQIGVGARQDLDRDRAAQPRVGRLVDLAHPARAERRDDLVRADANAGGEAHAGVQRIIAELARATWITIPSHARTTEAAVPAEPRFASNHVQSLHAMRCRFIVASAAAVLACVATGAQ